MKKIKKKKRKKKWISSVGILGLKFLFSFSVLGFVSIFFKGDSTSKTRGGGEIWGENVWRIVTTSRGFFLPIFY